MDLNLTLIIIGATALISYQAFNKPSLKQKFLHWPYQEHRGKEWYRLLTSGFIHANPTHLFINMLILFFFGPNLEHDFQRTFGPMMGSVNFILLYLLTIVAANIPTNIKHKNNPSYRALGASGATSGVLFACLIFDPNGVLLLYFIIPIPFMLGAIGYLVYSSWASKNKNDNIGHDAHFYGALFGFLFCIVLGFFNADPNAPNLLSQFINEFSLSQMFSNLIGVFNR